MHKVVTVGSGPKFSEYLKGLNILLEKGWVVKFTSPLAPSPGYHGGILYVIEKDNSNENH